MPNDQVLQHSTTVARETHLLHQQQQQQFSFQLYEENDTAVKNLLNGQSQVRWRVQHNRRGQRRHQGPRMWPGVGSPPSLFALVHVSVCRARRPWVRQSLTAWSANG